jgi:hypothetical protein
MATFYLSNHLYPDNPHLFIVDVKQVVKKKGEPNTDFYQDNLGDNFWEIKIYTSGLDPEGVRLGPYWVDVIGSELTIDQLISDKVNEICNLIDWSKSPAYDEEQFTGSDVYAPYIYYQYPSVDQENVPVDSRIIFRLREHLPAKGIDSSSVVLKVDGFTITPEITGNPYDLIVSYRPKVGE